MWVQGCSSMFDVRHFFKKVQFRYRFSCLPATLIPQMCLPKLCGAIVFYKHTNSRARCSADLTRSLLLLIDLQIGNCVGAKNHRFFFVFLSWTFMACSYMFIMAARAILRFWPKFLSLQRAAMGTHAFDLDPRHSTIESYTELFSIKVVVLIYLLMLGLGTSVCLGLLLSTQLQLMFDGQTYVESIQGGKSERGRPFILSLLSCHLPESGKKSLQRVFGEEHPICWLRPRLRHPFGSLAKGLEDGNDHEP